MLFNIAFNRNYTEIECTKPSKDWMLMCPHLQIIHPKNVCIPNLPSFVHPKFIVKIDANGKRLTIKTGVEDKYRLWLQTKSDYEVKIQSKCPPFNWMQSNVQCIRFTGNVTNLSIDRFVIARNIVQFCVSYVAGLKKKFWPLHCVSIYWPAMEDRFMRLDTVLGLSMIANVTGFISNDFVLYLD